jgi:hypothetical protein
MGVWVNLRDDVERVLRAWNAYEVGRGTSPVVDFDCCPPEEAVPAATSRLAVRDELGRLLALSKAEDGRFSDRLEASIAYVDALLGVRASLSSYVEATQGCPAMGWPSDYVASVGDIARSRLSDMGVPWDSSTYDVLDQIESPLNESDAPDAIRAAAKELEPLVRAAVGSAAPFDLSIEQVDVDAYWAYWLDGAGPKVRMRINRKHARFTEVQARQFALHEILGHGLQCASYSERCATQDVPWIRLTAVHAQQQVLLEGLAQALPLFVTPKDQPLITRVRLAHYLELVRAELHLAINDGIGVAECVRIARDRVPFWTDERIADVLTDRSVDPLLRSYLWSYPAGIDWFSQLGQSASAETVSAVLHAAYRDPLTPADLMALWPEGPAVGGGPVEDSISRGLGGAR